MPKLRFFLVCYDVQDDRNRLWVARRLARHGRRVQKSVFECFLDSDAVKELVDAFRRRLTLEDEVGFYPLCSDCRVKARTTTKRPPDRLPAFKIV